MKLLLTLFALFTLSNTFCQENNFESYLKAGKDILKSHEQNNDYALAIEKLSKAVALKPDNAEAHYFLGYAYDRKSSFDGKTIPANNLALIRKASNEFETVNKLTPKYEGEYLLLDPYSKISSEWGSMAMCYWAAGKIDSTQWALAEGKRRGGFSEMYLSISKNILKHCNDTSILLSYGDNATFSFLYCQMALGIRKDVTVIDISLLNTIWYPALLADEKKITFDLPRAVIDTLDYCFWEKTKVSVKDFSWSMPPSYMKHYLLRGDRVLLSMLKANNFSRSIYITPFAPSDVLLGLDDYIQPSMIVQKLNVHKKAVPMNFEQQKKEWAELGPLLAKTNTNSHEELVSIDMYRYEAIKVMGNSLNARKEQDARALYNIMNSYVDEALFPIASPEITNNMNQIKDLLKH